MKRYVKSFSILVGLFFAIQTNVRGDLITQTLGHQAYADGTHLGTATFQTAHAGDPAPFDGAFIGSDVSGPNFSASWTFSYGAVSNIASAALALGIYDGDSAATGDQVASFTINGVDLTSLMNAAFEANQGSTGFVNDYSIAIPSSVFSQLETGTATVSLSLQGPGLGVLGDTSFNGAALDFSTIAITTPEPSAFLLAGMGLLGLLLFVRKRK
jgi:hypothetical protein